MFNQVDFYIYRERNSPKFGTVTVTWLFEPTSTVATRFLSTLAGLKSSENKNKKTQISHTNTYKNRCSSLV